MPCAMLCSGGVENPQGVGGEPRSVQETLGAQDGMLVMYLSNLVRAHLALADKLGTAALPIL